MDNILPNISHQSVKNYARRLYAASKKTCYYMDTDDFVQDIYLQFLEMLNRNSEKDVKNTHFKIKFAFLNTLRHIRVQHKHRYNTATNNEWETTISSWSYRRKKEHDLELEYAVKEIYENIKSKLPPTQKQILDFIILNIYYL